MRTSLVAKSWLKYRLFLRMEEAFLELSVLAVGVGADVPNS